MLVEIKRFLSRVVSLTIRMGNSIGGWWSLFYAVCLSAEKTAYQQRIGSKYEISIDPERQKFINIFRLMRKKYRGKYYTKTIKVFRKEKITFYTQQLQKFHYANKRREQTDGNIYFYYRNNKTRKKINLQKLLQ